MRPKKSNATARTWSGAGISPRPFAKRCSLGSFAPKHRRIIEGWAPSALGPSRRVQLSSRGEPAEGAAARLGVQLRDDLTAQPRVRQNTRKWRVEDLPDYSHGSIDVHAVQSPRAFASFSMDRAPLRTMSMRETRRRQRRKSRPIPKVVSTGPHGLLHVRQAGAPDASKTPLVMFHMSPNSGRIYEALQIEMARDRVSLAPDTPGFGESDPPLVAVVD